MARPTRPLPPCPLRGSPGFMSPGGHAMRHPYDTLHSSDLTRTTLANHPAPAPASSRTTRVRVRAIGAPTSAMLNGGGRRVAGRVRRGAGAGLPRPKAVRAAVPMDRVPLRACRVRCRVRLLLLQPDDEHIRRGRALLDCGALPPLPPWETSSGPKAETPSSLLAVGRCLAGCVCVHSATGCTAESSRAEEGWWCYARARSHPELAWRWRHQRLIERNNCCT